MKIKQWDELKHTDLELYYKEYREFMHNIRNKDNCEECPHNLDCTLRRISKPWRNNSCWINCYTS